MEENEHTFQNEVTRCWKLQQVTLNRLPHASVSFPRHAEPQQLQYHRSARGITEMAGKPPAPGGCPGTTGSHPFEGKRTEELVISMRENYTQLRSQKGKNTAKVKSDHLETW